VWRPGDGGAELKAAALGGSSARARGEAKRGACEVRSDPRVVLAFYRGRGGLGVEMPASNGRRFTVGPLMVGEGGINGDSWGENQGGE
jgi:hypothetical protein